MVYGSTVNALIEFEYDGDHGLNAYEARQVRCELCDAP
jgi:hypothetical protein